MAIRYQHALDRKFHALGDGTRRQILAMLSQGDALSANQLRAPFNVAQPTISKHLKVLETAGLIDRKIDGATHRFHLNISELQEAEDWLSEHRNFWESALNRLGSFLDKKHKKK